MNNTELYFERPMLLWIALPVCALLIGSFFFLSRRSRKSARRIVALVLHCGVALILTVLLAGIGLKSSTTKQSAVILVDRSLSMGDPKTVYENVSEIIDSFGEDVPAGVVAFGKDQIVQLSIGEKGELKEETVVSDATDIEGAVRYALGLLPDDSAKRIILLSDGNETDGDARSAARMLQTTGVRVDTVSYYIGDLYEKEVQITSIEGASTARKGERMRLGVHIDSVTDCSAELWLTDNGDFFNAVKLDLHAGSNTVDINFRPREEGVHDVTARLKCDEDTIEVNNVRDHTVTVSGNPKILLVSPTNAAGGELWSLLEDQASVTRKTPYGLPTTIMELCKYDGVILNNISKSLLPSYFDSLLDLYVGRYGKPLLVVGGDETLTLGGMEGTFYEDILPVYMSYQKAQTDRAVAMMLVIDCSRSMGNGNALALAKQSAIRCLDAISEEDYVGVISFCAETEVIKKIGKCTPEYKEELRRAISGISIGAGTKYTPALQRCLVEMEESSAPVKHVIFLSDGEPSDTDYYEAARELIDAGVTISTIGLRYSSGILPQIASIGLGRYNYVSSVDELPDIMLSEAQMVSAGPLVTGKFPVKFERSSALTAGINSELIAPVLGYVGTTAKADADVIMTVNGDPLYATRKYGKGTVAVFTSQLCASWTSSWTNNSVCEDLICRIVLASADPESVNSSLALTVVPNGNSTLLRVETAAVDARYSLSATVTGGEDEQQPEFKQIGRDLFEAYADTGEPGMYSVALKLKDEHGEIVDFSDTVFTVSYSAEYDAFARGGSGLLEDIAALTGGTAMQSWEDFSILSDVDTGTVTYTRPIILPLGIIAALLFLVDVTLRRIHPRQKKKKEIL